MFGFRIAVFFLFLVVGIEARSQYNIIKKLAIPLEADDHAFNILQLDEKGFLLYRQRNEPAENDKINWELLFYDREMDLRGRIMIQTAYFVDITGQASEQDKAYLLFGGQKNIRKKYFLYALDINSFNSEKIDIQAFVPEQNTYFSIFNNTIILGGKERGRPSIVFFDPSNGTTVVLQGMYERNMVVFDAEVDEENGIFSVVSRYRSNARQSAISVRSYDESGGALENIRLEPGEDLDYIYARGFIANHNLRIIAGTYRTTKSSLPLGFFLSSINLNGESMTVSYPMEDIFIGLDSLFSTQGSNSKVRLLKNYDVNGNFHWYITDLIEYQDHNIMVAESFHIEKDNASFSTGDGELYFYHKALVIGFDDQLSILWMNDMDLTSTCSDNLEKIVNIEAYTDSIKLYFMDRRSLVEKIIQKSKSLPPRFLPPVVSEEMVYDGVVDCASRLYHFRHWHDDYFLFSGLRPDPEDNDKDIFFVYKIHYP